MATIKTRDSNHSAGIYSNLIHRIKSHRLYHRYIGIQVFAAASGVLFMSQAKADGEFWLGVLVLFVALAKFIHIDYHNRRWESQEVDER